ncbi:hypothetical protein SOVF_054000 [Spinacia oleracea]|nr:hypothetical protein SOVF_054000 [Spinacia oleracea]
MSFRVMMAGVARVSSRRNNLNHGFLSLPPPPKPLPTAVGTSLRHLSYYCRYADRLPPSCAFRAKYGYPYPSSSPAEEMRKKQPSYDTSSDDSSDNSGDESEADGEQKKPNYKEKQSIYVKHGDEALYVKMDMPGVGKEDVKIYVEGSFHDHALCVKGVRKSDPEFDECREYKSCPKSYEYRLSLTPNHKVEGTKAEMMNGVLKVTIPKARIEERMDVVLIPVN